MQASLSQPVQTPFFDIDNCGYLMVKAETAADFYNHSLTLGK
jgi:hypothetical protein